jgi:hypothetical protein
MNYGSSGIQNKRKTLSLPIDALFPTMRLPSRACEVWTTSGMDTLENCNDAQHFQAYPYPIEYRYNSRGFRDQEWPDTFDHVIWCVGDSFTVGIGSPVEHTWCYLLQQRTSLRTINVSMDGASNAWISRRACEILASGLAQRMVIQWSYTHRRESLDLDHVIEQRWQAFYRDVRDQSWPVTVSWQNLDQLPAGILREIQQDPYFQEITCVHDEERRIDIPERQAVLDPTLNTVNFTQCVQQVWAEQGHCDIVHSFIPDFSADTDIHAVIQSWPPERKSIPEIQRLDWARDHHHYDLLTAAKLTQDICNLLTL